MTLGPVEFLSIEFRGDKFKGDIVLAIKDVVDRGIVRLIDATFVRKDQDGSLKVFELNDLDEDEAIGFDPVTDEITGLISEKDIQIAAQALEANSSAVFLLFEHKWAAAFKKAVLEADGRVIAKVRIPRDTVEAAVQAKSKS